MNFIFKVYLKKKLINKEKKQRHSSEKNCTRIIDHETKDKQTNKKTEKQRNRYDYIN